LKYDGYRAIVGKHKGAKCLETLPDMVLDGELVVLDDQGRAQFEPIAPPGAQLTVRKAMLKGVLKDSTRIRYVQHIGENGVRLFQAAAEPGVEGIVAKRADSPYRRGRTSG
jgi:ATP-dependent DNA ligase